MPELFSHVMHPADPTYQQSRREMVRDLTKKYTVQELREYVNFQSEYGQPLSDESGMSSKILSELYGAPYVPGAVKGSILDSGGYAGSGSTQAGTTTTGGLLVRQDLEVPMYALFVKQFPLFDYLQHGPANGLVHTATQITSPETSLVLGNSLVSEVGTVNYVSSAFARATFPIAVFATGRGVSIKELAAVSAGGANYDPMGTEMANGMIRLSQDVQFQLFQGNFSNNTGTAANEGGFWSNSGAYTSILGFDGLRGTLGAFQTFSANNSLQVDMGALNMTEAIQTAAARLANAGGSPSAVVMSMNAKQALDQEQQGNIRYGVGSVAPGSNTTTITWANGSLNILAVPGNTLGTYNRTSDGALVEDAYVLDESTVRIRYLYSDGFTVLQIPTAVDGVLSMRYIVFGMFGLEIAAPVFNAKIRRLAS